MCHENIYYEKLQSYDRTVIAKNYKEITVVTSGESGQTMAKN